MPEIPAHVLLDQDPKETLCVLVERRDPKILGACPG